MTTSGVVLEWHLSGVAGPLSSRYLGRLAAPTPSNTSKTRTHSLFRQGCMLYELIPNMPEHRLVPLIERFAQAVSNANEFNGLFVATEMRG